MCALKALLPIFAALISAIALLIGYGYQKELERDAEIRKTRQGIYSRLVGNITERNTILGRLEQSPDYIRATPEERVRIESKDTELAKNEGDRTEIVASLCLYGADDAIVAYTKYAKVNMNIHGTGGDLGELVLDLRKSIYNNETHLKSNEIPADLLIWNDPEYLNRSAQAR